MSPRPAPVSRADWTVTAEQPDLDRYHVRAASPDGARFAQWWVYPTHSGRYAVCARPDPQAVIVERKTYDDAVRAANLRARHWLGSCWGLTGAARRLP